MAAPLDQTNRALATRLISAANGIAHRAAVGLERDLRDAAERIQEIDRPMAVIPRLVSDLARIANSTMDADTQRRLRRLLGEAQ